MCEGIKQPRMHKIVKIYISQRLELEDDRNSYGENSTIPMFHAGVDLNNSVHKFFW